MSFQILNALRAPRRAGLVGFFAAGLAAMPGLAVAGDLESGWSGIRKSSARLIAAPLPGPEPGGYRAGVEIRLDPHTLTYWRTPGDAGAPPELDFSASENIAEATLRFPAPTRFLEDGVTVFGYRDAVIFPLSLRLKDPAKPARLSLALSYAVCGEICIPVAAKLALDLPRPAPARAPGSHEAALVAAEAKTPRPLEAPERELSLIRDPAAAQPTWRLRLRPGAEIAAPVDLFAEGPPGWFFETREGETPGEFLIVQTEAPAGASGARVALTLSAPPQAYEFTLDLDSRRAVADSAPDTRGKETQ